MHAAAFLIRAINRFNGYLGQIFSWLTLGIVLVCFAVVVLRYLFSIGFIWMQDLYVWMNAIMFTGIAGYTFLRNGHVRVDIFYRPAGVRFKAWVDLIGFVLFLMPFCSVVVYWSWRFVERSWGYGEGSRNIGGMPGLYVVKSFIVVFAVVVLLQGLSMVLRSLLVLGHREDLVPQDMRYGEGG